MGNAAVEVPLLGRKKILSVLEKQVLDSWVENDRTERTLGTGGDVAPVAVLIVHEHDDILLSLPRIRRLRLQKK
jgi:hypothetical protein